MSRNTQKPKVNDLAGKTELLKLCAILQIKLTVRSKSDFDGTLLCGELISILFLVD